MAATGYTDARGRRWDTHVCARCGRSGQRGFVPAPPGPGSEPDGSAYVCANARACARRKSGAADRHDRNPITYRPAPELWAWLDDIAAQEGKPVRTVLNKAVERERRIRQADVATLQRELEDATAAFAAAQWASDDQAREAFQRAFAAFRAGLSLLVA